MRGYVETALGQVHYVDEGEGPPLLLLPQAGRSSRMFADLLPLLSPRFRVIAIDPPGFGNSDPLPQGTKIEQISDCIGEIIQRLGLKPAHVYGLHTGNKIATALAVRRPDLVASVVVSGQSHSIIPDRYARAEAIHAIVERDIRDPENDARKRAEDWSGQFAKLSDLWWSADLLASGLAPEQLRRARNKSLDLMSATGVRALYAANFDYDLGTDLRKVGVPLLVLEIATEEEDAAIGRQAPAIEDICPQASIETIEEPDGPSTLEGREEDLARIIMKFLAVHTDMCSS